MSSTASPRRPQLLLGLIGAGIQLSRTPAMHEAEGAAQGLNTLYRLIDLNELGLGPDALPDLLLAAERMGCQWPGRSCAAQGIAERSVLPDQRSEEHRS